MPLRHGAARDLLEEVVERVVAARHEQHALLGVTAVQRRDQLHRHVRLARARRALDHRQTLLQPRPDRLHLRRREPHARAPRRGVQREGLVLLAPPARRRRAHDLVLLESQLVRRRQRLHRRAALVLEAHGHLREAGAHVRRVLEGVAEVHGAALRDGAVVRRRGVAVPQQHVPEPVGQRQAGGRLVQQRTRRLQHCLEVVLGGVAPQQQVEGLVATTLRLARLLLHVQLVLSRVEPHRQLAQLARALESRVGVRQVVEPHTLLVLHRHHLTPAQRHHALLRQERAALRHGIVLLSLSPTLLLRAVLVLVVAHAALHLRHEHHVVLAQRLPLLARLALQPVQREQDLAAHLRRQRLAHLGLPHFRQAEGVDRHAHARLSREHRVALQVQPAAHRVDRLAQLRAHLPVGLCLVQQKVALEEVAVGQVLQVQRRQQQRRVLRVAPQPRLRRQQR